MKGREIATAATHWQEQGVAAVVWDGANSHWAPEVQQPPYAPELNPTERVFEDLRQHCEGHPYATDLAMTLGGTCWSFLWPTSKR